MSHNFQTTRLVCLLIAIAGICCPLAVSADDAATTNAPAPAVIPETTPAPATTNVPTPVVVSETTNAPAIAPVPELTNSPTTTIEPPTTNTPAPAIVPVATNPPPTVVVPAITNTPAVETTLATTNQLAPAPAPATTPASGVAPAAATASGATNKPATPTTPKLTKGPSPFYQPFNLGVEAGTTGFGGTAGWRFADHFGLVGGVDYLTYSWSQTIESIPYNADLRLMTEYAGLNLYPWRKSSFYLSAGAYFNQNRLNGSSVSDGSLFVNGYPLPAGESVSLEYKQQPVVPYVAIGGKVYFDRARHFSLGAELGAYYLGNPRVNVTSSDPLATSYLDGYKQQVEDQLKKIPVWPILKLSLNYSF